MKRLLEILGFLVLMLMFNNVSIYAQVDVSDSTLILYYDFEKMDMATGVVFDNSNYFLDGQIYKAYEATGYNGRCLDYLEEDSSRVNLGNSSVLDVRFITAAAWVNPESYGTDDKRIEILEKEMSYWLNIRNNNDGKDKDHNNEPYDSRGHLRVGFFAYSDSADQAERKAYHEVDNKKRIWKRIDSDKIVELNEWTHVAMVYNGDSLFAYLNGRKSAGLKIDSLQSSQTEIMKTKWNFVIGQKHAQKTYGDSTNIYNAPFNGKIDELVVYNMGKTHNEVYNIYKNTLTHLNHKLESGVSETINVYPNPATQNIYIRNKQFEKENIVAIYNIQGKEVYKSRTNNTDSPVYISDLKRGVYILKLYQKNGVFMGSAKFIKN